MLLKYSNDVLENKEVAYTGFVTIMVFSIQHVLFIMQYFFLFWILNSSVINRFRVRRMVRV